MRRSPHLDVAGVLADLLEAGPAPAQPSDGPVLDAASALLNERGMRGWTVEDVAARAGVGRATVYRRFASRDELVRAAVGRDARRFFRAVAESVAATGPLEEQVVEGFLVGLRLVQASPLTALLRSDPAAALSVLTAEPLLHAAAAALADRYEAMLPAPLGPSRRTEAEVAAEGLVRLGLSFVLIPGPAGAGADDDRARRLLQGIISPLLAGRSEPRRSSPRPPAAG